MGIDLLLKPASWLHFLYGRLTLVMIQHTKQIPAVYQMRMKNRFLSETHPQSDDVVNHEGAPVHICMCLLCGKWVMRILWHPRSCLILHLFSCFRLLLHTPSSVCSRCDPLTHSVLVAPSVKRSWYFCRLHDLLLVCSYLCTKPFWRSPISVSCSWVLLPVVSPDYTFLRISASQTRLP